MKKIIALILTLALVAAFACFFVGCGSDDADEIEMVNINLSSEQYGFAVKKGDAALRASVNAFFAEKKTEVDAIFAKYMADNVDLDNFGKVYATESTNRANELVVATSLDFPPFEYVVGNKIAGIDMEIAELLAAYLGKTLVVQNMPFEAVVSAVQTGSSVDIGISGLTITDDRKKDVDFSDPYVDTTQVLLVKKGDKTFSACKTAEDVEAKLKSLKGNAAICGGQKGTTSQFYVIGNEALELEGFSNLTFKPYTSAQLAVQDMLNGRIAFVVVDKITAQALVKSFND